MNNYKSYISLLLFTLLLSANTVFAQAPYITSIDKTNASTGATVLILGLNFPSTANVGDLVVKFGAAHVPQADIVSNSETLIEVKVPSNATFDNITVTDTATGLTAFSNEAFGLGFGGTTFSKGLLDPIFTDVTGFNFTFDLCMCDFDNNGITDIATTNNGGNSINIFTNTSTPTTVNLSQNDIDFGIETLNITCGDLNGDGKPDLVVTRGGSTAETFFVLTNTSPNAGTVSFDDANMLTITFPRQDDNTVRSPKRPIIQDIDLDGKPDLIFTNIKDNILFIYKNNSNASISFENTPTQIVVNGITNSSGLDVKDLNNDGLPEIVFIEDQDNHIYILPNNSEPGTILLGDLITISVNGAFRNLKVGDLNNDGFNDIAASNFSGHAIVILKNLTSELGGNISFDSPISINNTTRVFGIDLFDAEGDGDLDIVAASESDDLPKTGEAVYILLNDDPANLTFSTEKIQLTKFVRNIKAGDLNGDGKPDIAFTYNSANNTPGELGIIINRNCVVPKISPSTDQTICTGTTIRLRATGGLDATYDWLKDGVSVKNSADDFIDITGVAGSYTVKMTANNDDCVQTSTAVIISIDTDPSVATVASNDTGGNPVCVGTDVVLSSTVIAAATYIWSGPDGFTSSGTDANLTLSSVQASNAGVYSLVALKDGCTSAETFTTVAIETVPVIAVQNTNQDVFCIGSSVDISVTNYQGGYTYKWRKDGADISPAQNNTTLTVSESGVYSAVITSSSANACSSESQVRTLTQLALPVPDFDISDAGGILTATNSSICRALTVDLSATSTSAQDSTILNSWDFGDANTSSGNSVTNAYDNAGDFTITLTATYPNVEACSTNEQTTNVITITETPVVSISTTNDEVEKCPSESLTLSIPSNYSNYLWSTGDTTNSIEASNPDSYSVSASDEFGCDFTTADVVISNFTSSGIDIESTSTISVDNTITVAEGQLVVDLSVVNAAEGTIAWTPASIIEDTTLANVRVHIQDINTLITVIGRDAENCLESDTVSILNTFVRAKKVFSPNGDGIGDDCWEISNSRANEYAGCTIYIFDSKGSILQQMNGPFAEDCVWDGNIRGSQAPEGVYYYALKCSSGNLNLSGSILLAR